MIRYWDPTDGNDGSSGASPTQALKTLGAVLAHAPDLVLIKGGAHHVGQSLPPIEQSEIEFGIYQPTGTQFRAQLYLSQSFDGSTFTQDAGGTYSALCPAEPGELFGDDEGTLLAKAASLLECEEAVGDAWWWESGTLYVSDNPSGKTLHTPAHKGFRNGPGLAANSLLMSNIEVRYSSERGFTWTQMSHVEMVNCASFGAVGPGVSVNNSTFKMWGGESSWNVGDGVGVTAQQRCYHLIDGVRAERAHGPNGGVGQSGSDGISFHSRAIGMIRNCHVSNNSKYDLVHIQNALVDHAGVVCSTARTDQLANFLQLQNDLELVPEPGRRVSMVDCIFPGRVEVKSFQGWEHDFLISGGSAGYLRWYSPGRLRLERFSSGTVNSQGPGCDLSHLDCNVGEWIA